MDEKSMGRLVDNAVVDYYNSGIEFGRLRTGLGLIEFARTCEILMEQLPPPPAVVYDIGGGYGEYAWWLAGRGYRVHLYDLTPKNIEMSARLAAEHPGCSLECARVADARAVPEPDESADTILLFGPLYHIVERSGRQEALAECQRLLKPGGVLFSAAITRYATTLSAVAYGERNELLGDADFLEMIERELKDGQHIRKPGAAYSGMERAFFCLPDELRSEIADAGFSDVDVRGVIGPAWLVPNLDEQWKNANRRENILRIVRLLEREEPILGLSTHLLAVAHKPNVPG